MMKFAKKAIGAAAAAGIATAIALTAAAPASAATSDCASGYFCLWRDSNYQTGSDGTHLYKFFYYYTNFTNVTYSGTAYSVNDSASSVYNNGNSSSASIFQHASGGGWEINYATKTGQANLGTVGANDEASSGYFCSATSLC